MYAHQLREKADEWLEVRKSEGLRPATIQTYRDHITIFARQLGNRQLDEHTFKGVLAEYGETHSIASVQTIFTSMRSFLRGIGRPDLMGDAKKPRGTAPRKAAYSDGQMRVLFQCLRADESPTGLRDHAMCSLLRFCGLRAGELCGLRLDDLLDSEQALHVRRGKTSSAKRTIPLTAPCLRTVDLYLVRGRPKLLNGQRTDRVFVTVGGEPIGPDALRMMLRRRGNQVGFQLGAHRFRHTWATVHCQARTSPAAIGQLAGWSAKSLYAMLAQYSHPDLDQLRDAQENAFGA